VSADHPETVDRAIDIVFGHPFLTPHADEFGMFVANAAALRSAELGRQVGAAILNDYGEVLATGYNEVPAPMGGQYSADSGEDHREYTTGQDSSDEMRRLLAGSIEQKIRDAIGSGAVPTDAIRKALEGTHIRYLTEFGRALHAESSALMDAARRGVSVRGATIYVTTFPCHQCTRQVIASGCRRLVYVYPYPKSLAARFHGDAIFVDADGPATKVPFEPFEGVTPRRYLEAFTMGKRKDDDGKAVRGDDINRSPKLYPGDPEGDWEAGTYLVRESTALKDAGDMFKRAVAEPAGAEGTSNRTKV
jgi:deoxycytidylate deaminase